MAVYLLSTGSVFSITGRFATLDTTVIQGEVTIDNDFFDDRVWGTATSGKSEYRGAYQAIGSVRAFHDDTAASAVAADFAPGADVSVVTMTFVSSKTLVCNAHIHGFRITGNRQGGLTEVAFNFRSRGDFTTCTL